MMTVLVNLLATVLVNSLAKAYKLALAGLCAAAWLACSANLLPVCCHTAE